MKNLLLIATIAMTLNVSANVKCIKIGRYYKPSNTVAKDIAKALKVKTCTGARFIAMTKKLGMTSNVPVNVTFNKTALLAKYGKSTKK